MAITARSPRPAGSPAPAPAPRVDIVVPVFNEQDV
ncbi:MAG: hypothetical protein QOJ85_3617, partial [Solirubrobacteraceae bacterium]|nr:hypothetical protein [Solirubrobacteraceae bacterium]